MILALFGLAAFGLMLAGCSDIYFDRRETVSRHGGDSMAINRVTHMIDPWSPASANRNIAYNGEKMQTAQRYRTGRVIPPVNATTSSVQFQQAQQSAQSATNGQASSASANGSKP